MLELKLCTFTCTTIATKVIHLSVVYFLCIESWLMGLLAIPCH